MFASDATATEDFTPAFLPGSAEGREDQKWYWAALALLDAHNAPWMHGWCMSDGNDGWKRVNTEAEDEPASGFASHVARFADHFAVTLELGHPPEDLPEVLAEIALAGPAVCAMRSMHRVVGWAEWDEPALCKAAALVGEGFRSLFNLPETISFLRGSNADTYQNALGVCRCCKSKSSCTRRRDSW